MNRGFCLQLQDALLTAGYDDAELKYLSDTIATFTLRVNGVTRRIGVEVKTAGHATIYEGYNPDKAPLAVDYQTVAELATSIFDRDPGTHNTPEFKNFTGLTDET